MMVISIPYVGANREKPFSTDRENGKQDWLDGFRALLIRAALISQGELEAAGTGKTLFGEAAVKWVQRRRWLFSSVDKRLGTSSFLLFSIISRESLFLIVS